MPSRIAEQKVNPKFLDETDHAIINTYAWFRMVQAQAEDKLPLWCGIRLVRDETLEAK